MQSIKKDLDPVRLGTARKPLPITRTIAVGLARMLQALSLDAVLRACGRGYSGNGAEKASQNPGFSGRLLAPTYLALPYRVSSGRTAVGRTARPLLAQGSCVAAQHNWPRNSVNELAITFVIFTIPALRRWP